MIVAMNIRSESGDSYLLLFKDKTVQEIEQELLENKECYYGAGVEFEVLDCTEEEEQDLIGMIHNFQEKSWDFD
jgi:hypothetical protein